VEDGGKGLVDPLVARLVDDAARAERSGDSARQRLLLAEAAERLFDEQRFDAAIDLYITARDYASAARIAERAGDSERANELKARATPTPSPMGSTSAPGFEDSPQEPVLDEDDSGADRAERCEREGDLIRAAGMYEELGDPIKAANLLVDALSGKGVERIEGGAAIETARHASHLYASAGQIDRAVGVLRKVGLSDLAFALLSQVGRREEAVELGAKASDEVLDADDDDPHRFEEPPLPQAVSDRAAQDRRVLSAGEKYEQAGDYDRAARMYEYAGELARAAKAYERAGQHRAAANLFEKAGNFDEAARCLRASGSHQAAQRVLDRASTSQARSPDGTGAIDRAESLLARGRRGDRSAYVSAVEALSRITRQHADYVRARTLMATALSALGRTQEAMRTLQELLRGVDYEEGHLSALYEYGKLLELEGHLAEARSTYRIISDLHPTFMDVNLRMMDLGTTGIFELEALEQSRAAYRARAAERASTPVRKSPPRAATPVREVPASEAKTLPGVSSSRVDPRRRPGSTSRGRADDRARRLGGEYSSVSEDVPPPGPQRTPPADPRTIGASLTPADIAQDPESLIGLVLHGRFRVERVLGRGSQATVYLSRDVLLDRSVAIKVLESQAALNEQVLQRFLAEARFGAKVHHPCSLGVYDFGREEGVLFLAMEYFEGKTLRDHLAERGSLPAKAAIRVARDAASALAAVHKAGIIHRDVKPSNIMIDEEESIRLADFGVATTVDAAATPPGIITGTLRYMAPEQGIGPAADPKSDVYSLGVVLHEMLSGTTPFGSTVQSLVDRLQEPPPQLPRDVRVQESLRKMLERCLSIDVGVRPSARDMAQALEQELKAFDRERYTL
jgi:tetratricopeptide (TPR) repeat protein